MEPTDNNSKIEEPKVPENNAQGQTETEENPKDKNWRLFRQQREEERKLMEQAKKEAEEERKKAQAFKEAMESILNKPQGQQQQTPDISEEERINRLVEQGIQRQQEALKRQREEEELKKLPTKIREHHKDFDHVVSQENLDYLEYHHPEITRPYSFMPDSYEKWDGVYLAIKKHVPNMDASKDLKKAEANLKKPQAFSQSGGTKELGQKGPLVLTEERRKANWERMQKTLKGVS